MSDTHFLFEVLVFLATAVAVVTAVQRLRISPVVGYLVAGALIGPSGLAVITDAKSAAGLAELGVVFLLFAIGLEFSFARLIAMRRLVFGLGGAQVLVCGLIAGGVAALAGQSGDAAFVIGAALALSSTAMVAMLLRARGEVATATGSVAFAVLLFQDLLVVPLLVAVPLLAGDDAVVLRALGLALLKATAALAVIVLFGRLVLRPAFRAIAAQRNPELLTALTLLVVLGTSWGTELAGLSLALGAFLAGLLLAETEYRHHVESDIQPFRGILIGLFFMTVGMSMNLAVAVEQPLLLAGIVLGLFAFKALAVAALCRLFGYGLGFSVKQGFMLSQAGEFAFVLLGLAATHGVLADAVGELLILAVGITIAVTPGVASAGRWLEARLAGRGGGAESRLVREAGGLAEHVVIAGFGRVGQIVARLMAARGLSYIAFDLDPGLVDAARRRGLPVHYGDASNRNLLRQVGAERARAAIVTIDDRHGAERAVALLRQRFPALPIYARGRDRAACDGLRRAGATATVLEAMESGIQLGGAALRGLGVTAEDVDAAEDALRADDYAALAGIVPAGGEGVQGKTKG